MDLATLLDYLLDMVKQYTTETEYGHISILTLKKHITNYI